MTRPARLAVTAGEPAGIGPDLCLTLADRERETELVVVADADLMRERARVLELDVRIEPWEPDQPIPTAAGVLPVWSVASVATTRAGQLDPENAGYVLRTLEAAVEACQLNIVDGMVTAPVHKGVINEAGIRFSGHTEFLQEKTGASGVVMMLATEGLRVALATTHLPLRDVPDAITSSRLSRVLHILNDDLRKHFGIAQPRILVAGLNPHAGEGGHLGREEMDVIEPLLERLNSEGMNLIGPLPADTLFTPYNLEEADAVLAMYHDQGLPVLKHKGFGRAVNISLGLPIIRTSVDHGTALDLAATGQADAESLHEAIQTAAHMVRQRERARQERA
ncbi:4-hydroxythreonine-4-phosphate dehydrogenase PdxA [Halovibrio salipaludis]|uniref:4-hydroxythreonine-4-phosphate dehydrogenase n=1 Tax=Halovibrio salipaludis TaxID=2032626 RepID=A0A2A2FAB0_9GAMM|nr:4-hydroxythreonine-4-phosphate dehydrogenase PdxA [Halovibrio salipaludis]PAU81674.1 4-hydroxythreonine-4-phosphate dehydrogenase PdxA [Halovibrio salipaludis]